MRHIDHAPLSTYVNGESKILGTWCHMAIPGNFLNRIPSRLSPGNFLAFPGNFSFAKRFGIQAKRFQEISWGFQEISWGTAISQRIPGNFLGYSHFAKRFQEFYGIDIFYLCGSINT